MSLSQHVESASDIGLGIPSLRVEDYHRTANASIFDLHRLAYVDARARRGC
jgi:hypothetical protein